MRPTRRWVSLLLLAGCGGGGAAAPVDAGVEDAAAVTDGSSTAADLLVAPDLRASAVDGGSYAIAVVNHSFETPVVGAGVFNTTAPPQGWQAFGAVDFGFRTVGVFNPQTTGAYADAVPHGNNIGVVFLSDSVVGNTAGLQQTLAATLTLRTEYRLQIEVGNITSMQGDPYDFLGFPTYRIELLAGGTVLAVDDHTLLPGEGRFLTSTLTVTIGATHPQAAQPLAIRLTNLDASPGIEVNFDNVRLTATPQ